MKNHYRSATFLLSTPDLAHAPSDSGLEVAFAGRSNAGKSSAINTLTGIRSLARTSKTPGRTQQLIFFDLGHQRRLVDLPGYGYARVSEKIKRQWQQTLADYLYERDSLRGLVLAMDIRHPLTNFDHHMLDWCHQAGMPVHILLTKSDKLKRGPAQSSLLAVGKKLREIMGPVSASLQLFSSKTGSGKQQLCGVLDTWFAIDDSGDSA